MPVHTLVYPLIPTAAADYNRPCGWFGGNHENGFATILPISFQFAQTMRGVVFQASHSLFAEERVT